MDLNVTYLRVDSFVFNMFRSDAKLMLSAANDGKIVAWGSSMLPASVVKVSKLQSDR